MDNGLNIFIFIVTKEVTVVVIILGVGIGRVSQLFLHLIILHFPPLFVTTSPGGGETYCLQTVVDVVTP